MKKLDKIILALFSVLIFLESVLVICIITGLLDINTANNFIIKAFELENTSKIILAVAIICLLCSFKCIFFDSDAKDNKNKGVLMQNDNGKLLISKSTIENIVMSAVKDFTSVQDVAVSTDLSDSNNLKVNVNLVVNKNAVIKELTANIQNKIKEAIKKTLDLDVKEVNVKIKDISTTEENHE